METQTTAGYFLSPHQSHLWLLQQRAETQLSAQLAIRIEGPVDAAQLRNALSQVVFRYEILRTVFRRSAGMKTPFQVILPNSEPHWSIASAPDAADLSSIAEAFLAAHMAQPFDLEQGPMLRATLVQCLPQKHIFILTAPTLTADAPSLTTLMKEIFSSYQGISESLSQDPLRYIQFAQWQSDLLDSEDEAAVEGKAFWQQRMESGEQQVILPYESKNELAGLQKRLVMQISEDLFQNLKSVASASESTASDILLAVWQSLLFRLTGKARLAVGVILTGREYEELSDAVGLIARMLPIHANFEGNPRFMEIVEQVKSAVADAVGAQEYLDPARSFVDEAAIAFSYSTISNPQYSGPLTYSILSADSRLDYCKLQLNCIENNGSLELQFNLDSSRYEYNDIKRIAPYFISLLTSAVADTEREVARLPLLTQDELDTQVYDWNRTDSPYPYQTIHSLIEEQAQRTPTRLAVRFGDETLTYAELNRRSNQLAHHLRKLVVNRNSLIGLCLDRSADMMVAVLAIFKAGGAYVSLSGEHPKLRLQQQLHGAVALITEQKLLPLMPDHFGDKPAGPTLCLDTDSHQWVHEQETNPDPTAEPDDLVYVIYTSGSTGTPKGVGVRHRNLVNYSWAIAQQLRLAERPNGLEFATVSTLGADLGNTCIFPALISGGTLHIIAYDIATDAEQMVRYQAQYPVDVLKIVPSHLTALLHSAEAAKILPSQFLITGGEVLSRILVEEINDSGAGCQIINHYGPTETTVGSLIQPLTSEVLGRSGAASIPIGRPLSNTQVYILDSLLQPVPEGVTGDLYISGAGVSAGYLGKPELTAERFLPNPFLAGATMYRTGDLARHIPNTSGSVEFLGRLDDQVKIRGFRIELGEIESVLLQQSGVKQAVVLAREPEGNGEKNLVAYVVAANSDQVIGEQLRNQLKQQLPDYMVPSSIILLEKIPLTLNGKVDRKALPDADTAPFQKPYVEPSTATERTIAAIWGEVLHRLQVSADDNFFELGGHSLLATQVISRIRQQFSIEIALRTLFESPVLKALALVVDTSKLSTAPAAGPILRVSREAYRAPTSARGEGSTP